MENNTNLGGVKVSSGRVIPARKPNTLSTERIVVTVIVGILIVTGFCLTTIGLYNKWVKYPDKEKVIQEKTGIYCLENWESNIKSISSLSTGSYIAQEIDYANGSELKVNFIKKMLSTLSYSPKETTQKNIYGNDYINPETNSTEVILSTVSVGEEVTLGYIDYGSIEINEELLSNIMDSHDFNYGCVDYENIAVDIFCEYMLSLEEYPIKYVNHVPELLEQEDGSYVVGLNEDIFIDKLLFSSKEFNALMIRFSESMANISGVELIPSFEWEEWNSLSDEVKVDITEPTKYNKRDMMCTSWCGAYYLQNEYVLTDNEGNVIQTGTSANVGDGTFDSPAGLDTGIISVELVEYQDDKGNIIEERLPIRVTLREFGVAEDAITWFESKDERNRGIDVSSNVQYCYYIIEIENLSDKTITVKDNTALCDKNVNLSSRTGTMYGLTDEIVLEPNGLGYIESWNSSTDLDRKYVIWGQDFSRKVEPVWFRLLAGNKGHNDVSTNTNAN